jgi:histone H3/H4
MKSKLPLSVMEKLLKKAGAKRVSETAKTELSSHLEAKARAVSAKAIEFSTHAGRKTIKKEDINLVLEN